jgi:hypothetical protein
MTQQLRGTRFALAALAAASLFLLGAPAMAAAPRDDRLDMDAQEASGRPDHVEVRVVGRIRELSADGRTFTVESGEVSFRVEPGFATRFPGLRDGDRVLLLGTLRSQTRLTARDVQVLGGSAPRALTGSVGSIDRRRRRLTLRTESGETTEVEYTEDTLFARLGRRVTVDQIQVGDALWVDGRRDGERLVRATRIEVTGSGDTWQTGRSGEIVGVNRGDRTLRVDFGGETRTVNLGDRTSISRQNRELPADELIVGDQIRVSGELRGNAVDARAIELVERGGADRTVEGRVRGVDPDGRILRVTLNALIPITVRVYVPPDAQITRGTRRLTLEEIREGDHVRARGPSRDGRVAADLVEVLP